ncbi:hypothetical protein BN2475_270146 [Paraburkholderia ribeironis]|uniref:Uncharacterized protein n=1 Tax=Paraburkholderia ribeironis TaxID=1247936 RepID=A0A1N7S0L8_9BURK|nr:hypothetical protein BN2475_270146 [Paraburkholderia ribeironis]
MRQLVLDEWVIEDEEIGKTAVLSHGGGARGGKRDRFGIGSARRAAPPARRLAGGRATTQVYRKSAA